MMVLFLCVFFSRLESHADARRGREGEEALIRREERETLVNMMGDEGANLVEEMAGVARTNSAIVGMLGRGKVSKFARKEVNNTFLFRSRPFFLASSPCCLTTAPPTAATPQPSSDTRRALRRRRRRRRFRKRVTEPRPTIK